MTKQFMEKVVNYGWLNTKQYHYVALTERRNSSKFGGQMPCIVIYQHDKIALQDKPHTYIISAYRRPMAIYTIENGWLSWKDYIKTRDVKE